MTTDEKYMSYALSLAEKGGVNVLTNPKVGAVIVYDERIIGEGYHQLYGKAHAEVNAVDSVKEEDLKYLSDSTMYVNLEPCCHTGKTPPCTEKIIKHNIKRVVIGMQDPFPKVNGEGIKILRDAGVDVSVGVLEAQSIRLNREFIVFHEKKRPYIIFKWAQTLDGYIDSDRDKNTPPSWLTGPECKTIVHKWRSEIGGIMVGRSTIERDNARLNVRMWSGNSPHKVTIDRKGMLTEKEDFFINDASITVFTSIKKQSSLAHVEYVTIDFEKDNFMEDILSYLYSLKIKTLMVEGGAILFSMLLKHEYIDEARIFVSPTMLSELEGGENLKGVKAPVLPRPESSESSVVDGVLVKMCYY